MQVLFENRKGNVREIALVDTMEQAHEEINKFCEERGFVIHYTRGWIREDGAHIVDVGSHTEFFHIIK